MGNSPLRVFLSYSQADRARARRLAKELKDAGLNVWDPDQETLPGHNWHRALADALEEADAMVVLVSREGAKSREFQKDILYALQEERFENRLILVLMDETRSYPWALDEIPKVRYRTVKQVRKEILDLLSKTGDALEKSHR